MYLNCLTYKISPFISVLSTGNTLFLHYLSEIHYSCTYEGNRRWGGQEDFRWPQGIFLKSLSPPPSLPPVLQPSGKYQFYISETICESSKNSSDSCGSILCCTCYKKRGKGILLHKGKGIAIIPLHHLHPTTCFYLPI